MIIVHLDGNLSVESLFKEYVSIKNEFVEKMVRQRKTVHPSVI